MPESSIISSFEFISYKIDSLSLEVPKTIKALSHHNVAHDVWEAGIMVKQTIYFKKNKMYVSGLRLKLSLPVDEKAKDGIVKLESSISGLFRFNDSDNPLAKTAIDTIARCQFPTILFPFLRAAAMSLLANAGFGSVMIPLINVAEIAKQSKGEAVLEIDESSS